MKKLLSVIIPFYNEGENLNRIYEELDAVRREQLRQYNMEILLMDNHSTDDSFTRAVRLANQDDTVRVIRLSRNFGYQANILTGYLQCRGAVAVQLDADGEDDPRLIPQMVRLWEEGYKVVYGVRRRRVESRFMQWQRKLFYRMLSGMSSVQIPVDAGDFRLIDRKVIDCLTQFREANPYLRGLIAYAGFQQVGVEYDRRARYRGESKFSYIQYWRLAWDAVTSFSREPLNLSTWMGMIFATLSFCGALFYLGLYAFIGVQAAGFTTIILTLFFLTGIQLVCTGITGIYIGRIFDEVKQRPKSFIEAVEPTATSSLTPRKDNCEEPM